MRRLILVALLALAAGCVQSDYPSRYPSVVFRPLKVVEGMSKYDVAVASTQASPTAYIDSSIGGSEGGVPWLVETYKQGEVLFYTMTYVNDSVTSVVTSRY